MKKAIKSTIAIVICALMVLAIAFMFVPAKAATLNLNAMFGNSMVLQRGKPISVPGSGEPGEKVSAILYDGEEIVADANTTVGSDGKFDATLPAQTAGGPYTLVVTCGDQSRTFNDVMVGEVWIALGQSNMAMSFAGQMDSADVETLESFDYPDIRFKNINGGWEKGRAVTGGRAPNWYNVAVHFAKEIHEKYGVAVGVLQGAEGAVSILTYLTLDMLGREPKLPNYDFFGANYYKAGYMFDKTVAHIYPYTVQGVIWYQGETDCGDPLYADFMGRLVECYRELFHDDIYFIMTQLPSYREKSDPYDGIWHEARERMQRAADELDGVGIAITMDLYEGGNIHPGYKNVVGQRLASVAGDLCYGEEKYGSSPTYESHTVDGNRVIISFKNVNRVLRADGIYKNESVRGFQLAGEDGVFYNATVNRIQGNKVTISARNKVENPVYIRYCYTNIPQPNLYSSEGLPVAPFRTDTFSSTPAGSERIPFLEYPDPEKVAEEYMSKISPSKINMVNNMIPTETKTVTEISLNGGGNNQTFMKFDIDVPDGQVINSAVLRLYEKDMNSGSGTVSFGVYSVDGYGDDINWNNKPQAKAENLMGYHSQKGMMNNGVPIDIPLDIKSLKDGETLYMGLVPQGYSFFYNDSEFTEARLYVFSVAPADSIEITTPPTKTQYYEGDVFDTKGMKVTAHYENASDKVVTTYSVPTVPLTVGTTEITVSYGGATATVPITVTPKKAVDMKVTTLPNRIEYTVNQFFISTGCQITVYYNNGDREVMNVTREMLSDYDFSTPGEKTITVTVGEFTDSFTVTVKPRVAKGDADNDGKVSITDALEIFKILAGKIATPESYTVAFEGADCNTDGSITITDALAIFKHLAGKELLK